MKIFAKIDDYSFPPCQNARKDGLIAIAGKPNAQRLLAAYRNGVFPWYDREPALWYCPNPRMVLFPNELKVSKNMQKIMRHHTFSFTKNKRFTQVLELCAQVKRKGQSGTWLTEDLMTGLVELHQLGYAKSLEVWMENQLVGGLYGIELGEVFCGESMFHLVPNASKAGFIQLVQSSNYKIIDCQVYTDHLASLGAREIPIEEYLAYLKNNVL